MRVMARSWTADEFLRSLEDTLRPLVTEAQGVLDVATDPGHALEILSAAPSGWRAVLLWPGYGEHPEATLGMGAQRISIIIQAAKGLPVRPGDLLHRKTPLCQPLMALIENVSMWVRAMRFPGDAYFDAKGFALTGSAWFELEDLDTRQHQLDFTIACALPSQAATILMAPLTTP